jgi:hypothetical protein
MVDSGMLALPLDAQIIMQYSYSGMLEGVARPIVSVRTAYMQDGKPVVDKQGVQQYDTKSIRGTGDQIGLEVCSIPYKDSPFMQVVTLGNAVLVALMRGEEPTLKAPQGPFYGPSDTLCARA